MAPGPPAPHRRLSLWLILALAAGAAILLVSVVLCDVAAHTRGMTPAQCRDSVSVTRFRGMLAWAASLWLTLVALLFATRRRLAALRRDAGAIAGALRAGWQGAPVAHRWALLGILAIGVALRATYLSQPMRSDEAFTYTEYASLPLYVSLGHYTFPNNHLFHTLLVHATASALGSDPWTLRLPAFIAGALLIPAVYLAARALYDSRVALISAALVAGSGWLTLYATNARGYSIVLLLFVLQLALARVVKTTRNGAAWVLLALSAALALYTIPAALYPAGAVALWLLVSLVAGEVPDTRRRYFREMALCGIGAGVLTVALYLPVVVLGTGLRSLLGNRYVVRQSWAQFAAELPGFFEQLVSEWAMGFPGAVAAALAVAAAAGAVLTTRVGRERVPLWPVAVSWSALLLVINRHVPFTRVWLYLLPLAAMLAGCGLATLSAMARDRAWARRLGHPVLACVMAAALAATVRRSHAVYDSDDTGTLRDAPAITAMLKSRLRPGDGVVADVASGNVLAYYFRRAGVSDSYLREPATRSVRVYAVVNDRRAQTMDSVYAANALQSSRYGTPVLIRRFREARVFELHALGGIARSRDARRQPHWQPPTASSLREPGIDFPARESDGATAEVPVRHNAP